ncbi:formate dehydrogenase accessory sulfurtransferase FdhD, partial [Candidatus Aerophobetes bacterium]|nr:formate dehydrogenase accessory sulfurtransferase FdhD [Candidatus Aerophobetes bacterium]
MKLNLTSLIEIERIKGKERIKTKDKVIREIFLTIFAGERKVGTLLCTPIKLEYLAAGFLFTQGLITQEDKIKDIWFNPEKNFVQVITDNPKALEKRL